MAWLKFTTTAVSIMLMAHQLRAAAAYTCTVVRFGTSPETTVTSINNLGQTVGTWIDESGARHGFLRNADGTFVPLPGPSGQDFWPLVINNAGQILGSLSVGGSVVGGAAYVRNANGDYTELVPPPTPPGHVNPRVSFTGLNDAGQVVGTLYAEIGPGEADIFVFIREPDGQYRIVDQSGSGSTPVISTGPINNDAIFVEHNRLSDGFLINPSAVPELFRTPLTAPGLPFISSTPGGSTITMGLNNNLVTTGRFGAGDAIGSFLRILDGSFQSVSCPEVPHSDVGGTAGAGTPYAAAINDFNVIAGTIGVVLPSGEYVQAGFIARPTGVLPQMVICQRFITFGRATFAGPSLARIWVGNLGPADLRIGTVYVGTSGAATDDPFSFHIVDSNCARGSWSQANPPMIGATTSLESLPPWGDCYVDVGFFPRGPGTRTGALYALGDSPDSPQVVQLSGEGVSE
jgi:hypothetical protein